MLDNANAMERVAIYPGTFDPLTMGHFDLTERTASLFEHVVLAVAESTPKNTLFSLEERVAMTQEAVKGLPNVEVDTFDGLLINYLRSREARILIRGVRAFSDFEHEFQMALINRKLAPEIETLFMMPKETQSYVSSSRIKELASLGGDIELFVPPNVLDELYKRFPRNS